MKRLTQEEYILMANTIHKNMYDYTPTEYINMRTAITYKCHTHGVIIQKAGGHLKGGCKKCSDEKRGKDKRSSTSEFIRKATDVHNDIYIYDEVDYQTSILPVKIRCKIHGIFPQTPSEHLSGYGCVKCGQISAHKNAGRVFDTESFKKQALQIHQYKFTYDDSIYVDSDTHVLIRCSKHGVFRQTPCSHLGGKGCWDCASEYKSIQSRSNSEEFIQKAINIHNILYEYTKVVYTGCNVEVSIYCTQCNQYFLQTPTKHLSGHGCIHCVNKTESLVCSQLKMTYVSITNDSKSVRFAWCKTSNDNYLPFDMVILEYKIIIEVDGPQHFRQVRDWKSPSYQQQNDKYKMKCANDNGYSVIRIIQEDIYNDTYDWLRELKDSIESIKYDGIVRNVLLCLNDEYDSYY